MGNSELGFRKFIGAILPDLTNTIRRFPIEMLISVVLTAYVCWTLHVATSHQTLMQHVEVISGGWAAFLWTLAVNLRGKRYELPFQYTVLITLAGIAVIALLHLFSDLFEFQRMMFLPALFLCVGLFAYIGKEEDERAFWLFNHRIWVGAALGLAGALIFSGGLLFVVEVVGQLFHIDFPFVYRLMIAMIGFLFVFPLFWLSLFPVTFEEKVPEGKQTEFTVGTVTIFAKFLLIPLLFIYTIILYAYALRIGMLHETPPGIIGKMTLLYGLAGVLTVIFIYPSWRQGGPLTVFFWKNWFLLTLAPLVLLGFALYQRIEQYGITVERYVVWMIGLWLAYLAISYTISREHKNFRLMIGVLCAFLFCASFGPWGAKSVGVRGQIQLLQALLEKNDMLDDHSLKPVSPDIVQRVSLEDIVRIESILFYLNEKRSLGKLKPLFGDVDGSPFTIAQKKGARFTLPAMHSFFKIREIRNQNAGKEYSLRFSYSRYPANIPLQDYDVLAGPLNTYFLPEDKQINVITLGQLDKKKLVARVSEQTIDIQLSDRLIAQIDVLTLLKDVSNSYKKKFATISKENDRLRNPPVYIHKLEQGDYSVAFVIRKISGKIKQKKLVSYGVEGWMLVGRNKSKGNH